MVIHLIKLKSPSPKDALCQVWLKLPSNSGEEDHLVLVNVFCYYVVISPYKRAWPFI